MADPAVSALLGRTERRQADTRLPRKERQKKDKERAKMRSRAAGHTTYDLPVALRKRIKEIAERERLPASQLAALALLRLLQDLERQQLDLGAYKIASRSPRYDFILRLPLETLEGGRQIKGRPKG